MPTCGGREGVTQHRVYVVRTTPDTSQERCVLGVCYHGDGSLSHLTLCLPARPRLIGRQMPGASLSQQSLTHGP